MNMYPKLFSSTKNIPQTQSKHTKKPHSHYTQHHSNDTPFSQPYNPQDQFDFTSLNHSQQKYPFSLDPSSIFPRNHTLPFGAEELPQPQGPHQFESKEMPHFQFPDVNLDRWEDMVIEERKGEDDNEDQFF